MPKLNKLSKRLLVEMMIDNDLGRDHVLLHEVGKCRVKNLKHVL